MRKKLLFFLLNNLSAKTGYSIRIRSHYSNIEVKWYISAICKLAPENGINSYLLLCQHLSEAENQVAKAEAA